MKNIQRPFGEWVIVSNLKVCLKLFLHFMFHTKRRASKEADDMSEYILRTNKLSKKYKDDFAIENINVTIKKGEIYGFIGQKWFLP